jgi:hypothetical protein
LKHTRKTPTNARDGIRKKGEKAMTEKPECTQMFCPICGKVGVGLVCDSSAVVWCEAGHVSITDSGMRVKLVFDFEELEEE